MGSHDLYKLFQEFDLLEDYKNKKFKYLDFGYIGQDRLLIASIDRKPVGVLQLGQAVQDKNLYWMKFVTVHPEYRQLGIARNLIQEMCRHVSKIENAKIELSSYEKDGEVMMEMVRDIALEFFSLSIKHRTWGTPYQDAKNDFFRIDEEVFVDDSEKNLKGLAKIINFIEQEPIGAVVKLQNEEKNHQVLLKYLRKI